MPEVELGLLENEAVAHLRDDLLGGAHGALRDPDVFLGLAARLARLELKVQPPLETVQNKEFKRSKRFTKEETVRSACVGKYPIAPLFTLSGFFHSPIDRGIEGHCPLVSGNLLEALC